MRDTKPWYTSRTIWANIIGVLVLILHGSGVVEVTATEQAEIIRWASSTGLSFAALLMPLLSIWGRIKADKRISL